MSTFLRPRLALKKVRYSSLALFSCPILLGFFPAFAQTTYSGIQSGAANPGYAGAQNVNRGAELTTHALPDPSDSIVSTPAPYPNLDTPPAGSLSSTPSVRNQMKDYESSRDNFYRLYNEKLVTTKSLNGSIEATALPPVSQQNPAPPAPPASKASAENTAGLRTPALPQPITPVLTDTSSSQAASQVNPTTTASQEGPLLTNEALPPSSKAQPISSSTPETLLSPSGAGTAATASASVGPRSSLFGAAPSPAQASLAIAPLSYDRAPPAPKISDTGFTSVQAVGFIHQLAGADGVALNIADAAVPADIPAPMHLEEAVAFALKNNFEVLAADAKTKGAMWDKVGAYSEYMPSIQASADTGPEKSEPASINDVNGNRVLDNTHNRKDYGVSVSQPLIDLSIISDIMSGTDKKHIADTDERDVREGIAFDTISTFFNLLQSRISIRLADQYKGYLDTLADHMRARVEGGGATSADLDRIRGRSTVAESARLEALGEYESNALDLKRLIRVMPAQLVIPLTLAPAVPDTKETAMEAALKHNPSYISSLEKADLASDDRNKSFSGLLPKLVGQVNDAYSFNAGGAAEGNPVDGVYPTQRTFSVMLVAQWALNGGTAIAGGLSGMEKKREMDLRALDIRARIEQAVQTGYAVINATHQRENVLRRSIEDDQRVVTSFEAQYKTGGRSLFDMLDAYEQLYNARLNLMRVVISEAKASYQVRRQMGELQQSILSSEAN